MCFLTEVIAHMAFQQMKVQTIIPRYRVVGITLSAQIVLYKFILMNDVSWLSFLTATGRIWTQKVESPTPA